MSKRNILPSTTLANPYPDPVAVDSYREWESYREKIQPLKSAFNSPSKLTLICGATLGAPLLLFGLPGLLAGGVTAALAYGGLSYADRTLSGSPHSEDRSEGGRLLSLTVHPLARSGLRDTVESLLILPEERRRDYFGEWNELLVLNEQMLLEDTPSPQTMGAFEAVVQRLAVDALTDFAQTPDLRGELAQQKSQAAVVAFRHQQALKKGN